MALLPAALKVADQTLIFDNSNNLTQAKLVLSFNSGQVGYKSIDLPEWLNYLLWFSISLTNFWINCVSVLFEINEIDQDRSIAIK